MSLAVTAGKCGKCKALVVNGDCRRTHVAVRADAGPLSVEGQALAVLTRRFTFNLVRSRGAWVIFVRDTDEVIAQVSTGLGAPVLVEHMCHAPLPSRPGPTAHDLIAPPDMSEDALAHELGLPNTDPAPF